MRNLKRALSLTLASVMLLGMMVVGTSAASYPDVTEEHNVEAIEVLQAVGVMSGSDSGNFNPDSQVSRIEMAVVMSNLLNLKVDYFENQCRFTDVPAWAGKYVAACEASGIVSGIGNNQFGTGNVTATQAALMMLKALGYFQYASDFAGGWEQETAKLAANLSLFKGLDSVYNTTELTRNQVAQLALNTLKTPVVVPEDNTLTVSGQGSGVDFTINGGKVAYKVTASSDAYARAISSVEGSDANTITGISGYVIELGEKLYNGKLQLRENGRDGATVYDDFGRPARKWQYDGTTFGTYAKKEELRKEYTTKVTGKMLYDELGTDIVRSIEDNGQWKLNVTIDGEIAKTIMDDVKTGTYFSIASIKRTNTDKVGDTGNGVLTQVYVDSVHHLVDIAIINTYLAIAEQDYNEKDDDVDLKVYHVEECPNNRNHFVKTGATAIANGDPKNFDGEEIMAAKGDRLEIKDVKEDDKFLVTIAQGEIQSMVAPEVVSETTLNSFKKTDWVKNDDAQYDYASTAQYDDEVLDEYDAVNMKDVTYNVILDKYGYLVGLELNEGVAQYAFLTGIDLGESNLSVKNATANLIFLDGTMKTVTVNVEKSEYADKPTVKGVTKPYTITGGGKDLSDINNSNYITENSKGDAEFAQVNTWCTYTVDDNNVYTLKQVGSYSQARTDSANNGPVRNAKKVAQSYIDVTDYSESKDPQKLPINNKNTSIPGSANSAWDDANVTGGTAGVLKPGNPAGDFQYVYGNNDTVYINVKLKGVTAKGGDKLAIVDKVDSAVTGIANVDLTVEDVNTTRFADLAGYYYPKAEVYTLYNDKGYAIGVITMDATDNGTSSHFAYITSEVKQEDYMGGSTWRWHVDAIVDGVKVQLTEANDTLEYLSNMKAGEWYSVTYDKDGNVNGIKNEGTFNNAAHTAADKNKPLYFAKPTDDKFVTEVDDVRRATNGIDGGAGSSFTEDTGTPGHIGSNSTVLLEKVFRCSNHIANGTPTDTGVGYMKVEGDTLWTTTDKSSGIRISPSTKTVLILSKRHNSGTFDTITDGFTGAEGLDKALKTLKTDTVGGYTKFDGVLTAVFKDGVATSIILEDESGNGHSDIVENVKPMTLSVTVNFDDGAAAQTRTVYWHGTETLASLIGNIPGYAPGTETLPTFVEGGSGNASILYTKGTGAKITKAGSSVINAEVDPSFTAPIAQDVIDKSVSVETNTNANGNIVVTGTLEEAADATKTWYGTPASDYFLPLVFEAPYGVNAAKMDIKRNGTLTQSNVALDANRQELVLVGLTGSEKAVEFTVDWKNAAGTILQTSTFTVNLNNLTFAGASAGDEIVKTIRVRYCTGNTDSPVAITIGEPTQDIEVNGGKSGFGELTAAMCTAPTGWKVSANANKGNAFPKEVDCSSSSAVSIDVFVEPDDAKNIALNAENAKNEIELAYGATHAKDDLIAALKAAGVKFDVTFGEGAAAKTLTVDADSPFINNVAAKGSFDATADGKITVTACGASAKTVDVDAKVYTTLTIAGASDVATAAATADKKTAKAFAGDTVTVVFTAKDVGEYTAAHLASATKSVTPTGSTTLGSAADAPTYDMTHPGLPTATADDDGKFVITVTFKVDTLAAATDTITINIAK